MVEYSPELPEHIIHRIQSLLNPKEAAQTTLLSNSWRVAWSTRPTIDLDEADFQTDDNNSSSYPRVNEFPKFAKKIFRMYKKSNLRIDAFRLRLISDGLVYVRSGLATEWTLKALKLGTTDLTFEINHPDIAIPLDDAVCGRESVASLCLQTSKIDQLKVFKCPGLKSLTLSNLNITWESFFNIISCSPLIENLSLSHILGRYEDYESDHETYHHYYDDGTYEDHQYHRTYDDDDEQQQQQQQQQGVRSAPPTFFLHKLRSLVLCRISSQFRIKTLFLDDLSSKFPNLKHLTLELTFSNVAYFQKQREILILSSRSLEVLDIRLGKGQYYYEKKEMPRFEFDVPSIREFTLDCTSYMPNMCFTSASMDRCEARLSLTQHGQLSILWYLNLSKLLTELRGWKIHLCLHVDNRISFHYRPGEIKCLNLCELENLTINAKGFSSLNFNALLDGLFRICRPKVITQYNRPCDYDDDVDEEMYDDDYEEEEEEEEMLDDDEMSVHDAAFTRNINDVVLCRELVQGMKEKSSLIPSQHYMYGLRDLEELNVQKLFDGEWRPQPLDSVLDDSSQQRRFRFLLKWKITS